MKTTPTIVNGAGSALLARACSSALAVAFVLGAACSNPTAPARGTVFFRMSQVSCHYAGSKDVTFFVNGTEAGTESVTSGAMSSAYLTKASAAYAFPERSPLVMARVANYTASGGALWTLRTNIRVMENESITHTFEC